MAGRYTKLLIVALLLSTLAPFAAATWSIDEMYFFPEYSAKNADGVVTAQASDRNDHVISPGWCTGDDDVIRFRYDYDEDQINIPLEHTKRPEGWYYSDALQVNSSDDTIGLFTNGLCNGVSGEDSTTLDLSRRGQRVDGDFQVEFLTDVRGDGYWEEEKETFYWNVSRDVQFGDVFASNSNLSYRLYYPNGSLIEMGRRDTWSSSDVERGDGNFSAEIEIPKGAGRYILSAVAYNGSNQEVTRPYGGTAKTFWVKPTYLRGTGDVHTPSDRCRMFEQPTCEKGATVEVSFSEEYADATYVNVTVRGSEQSASGGEAYDVFNIRRWNETYWNGTYTIPTDYDTGTYGSELVFDIRGVHAYTRDGTAEKSTDTTEKRVNISSFKIVESTTPFVRLGKTMDLTFSPVTPYSERPVPVDLFTEARIRVLNGTHRSIYHTTLTYPFSESYNSDKESFIHSFDIPFNASTGTHTAHVTLTNTYGRSVSQAIPFDILGPEDVGQPVVVVAAGGEVDRKNLSKTYHTAGLKQENILLRNIGDSTATVELTVEGDIRDFTTLDGKRTVTIPEGQQHMFEMNLSLTDSRDYEGAFRFRVSGPSFQSYNLTVPADMTVQCKHILGTFCIKKTNVRQEVTSEGTYNMTLEVKNEGEYEESFQTVVQGSIAEFFENPTERHYVEPGNVSTRKLPFTVETHDTGYYNGSILLSLYGANDIVLNSSIDVVIDKGRIKVTPVKTDLGQFAEGDAVPVELRIENTGTKNIEHVQIRSEDLRIDTTRTIDLGPQNDTDISVDGTATVGPTAEGSEERFVEITVTPNTGPQRTVDVSLEVYPDYSEKIQSMKREVDQLKRELENKTGEEKSSIASDLERVRISLENAQRDWEKGYYGAAERKFTQADTNIQTTTAAIEQLEAEGGGEDGGSVISAFIFPMAIILFLFAISGIILYLSIVPEEGVR